jgi:serine/threonine-protein kinase
MFCTSCGNAVSEKARFCGRCGSAVGADADATVLGDVGLEESNLETLAADVPVPPRPVQKAVTPAARPRSATPGNPVLTSSDPIGGGRFVPGAMVADRYRIVALLGRGGMGEVYRAEDLKLSQVLAIKFLPEKLSQDPAALARFHAEVRIARQVSHPNVCRVFDIGDAQGIPFLTMEYVDGEDLSSVVRRIGRLPQDKAAEVSRQICAGLAAAHERGVIHRDLKPANVMLDGAGKARITDFGLASVAASMEGAEARAGTPAYMAPEQLGGKGVTAKSDIYSLGLVMYEIVTGKRAFEAATLAELVKSREAGTITSPSSIVKDLDPLVERAIFRCLDPDPSKRPSSPLQVAAALPGGDPLAAALAVGETPSPEMVAAAGSTEGIRPRVAVSCWFAAMVLLTISGFLARRENGLERMRLAYSPEIMAHKAEEIVASLGYAGAATDRAYGFGYDYDFLDYLDKKDRPGSEWNQVLQERPPLLRFWFRQSPKDLVATDFSGISLTPGVVTFSDPPETFSGMANLQLDPSGRLLYFQAMPPEKEPEAAAVTRPDWQPLFAAAGLNSADFRAARPSWNALASSDARAAWDGTWPGTTRALHIEAAAWRGKPVFFLLAGPWTQPSRMPPPPETRSQKAGRIFGISFALLLFAGGAWLAYRNYFRGKADRRGALRLAVVAFFLELVVFVVRAHLGFSSDTLGLLTMALSTGLFAATVLWMLYLALEPYVRSKWPQTIVSWSRLLAGSFRDPLVGRDILFGVVLGLAWVFVLYAGASLDIRAGEQPLLPNAEILDGMRSSFGLWLGNVVVGVFGTLQFFFLLVLLRVFVRNRWLAAVLFVVILTFPKVLGSQHLLIGVTTWSIVYAIAAFAVVRFGLVTLATAVFTANVLLNVPFTTDFSRWYAPNAVCLILSFVVIAVWAFYTAMAGQKLFKSDPFA